MHRLSSIVAATAAVLVIATAAVAAESTDAARAKRIANGKKLVAYGACHDCHSPKNFTAKGPEPDMKRALSGHPAGSKLPEIDARAYTPGYWILMSPDLTAFVGPWGVSYAANLTPDDQTGIGLWTEDVFVKAIRTGLHMGGGRPILPPMPWQLMNAMSDDELKDIFAYLKSLPPIKNPVPAPMDPPAAAGGK
jgi:cytochrome c553